MAPEELTLERAARYPLPGTNGPAAVRFSPDGRVLTYLSSTEGSLLRQLWAFDTQEQTTRLLARAPGEGESDATVSRDEALRRERQRIRGAGITRYAWAADQPVVLVPVGSELYTTTVEGGPLRHLRTHGEAIDPQLSPQGDAVAYVAGGELWLLELRDSASPRRLTLDAAERGPDGDQSITNGLAEFVAQEEMGRSSGFWWSKDGSSIAFEQVDVSPIPLLRIPHHGSEAVTSETHRYPFAGAANARVRLGVVSRSGGEPRWLPLADENEDIYLARVDWTPDGAILAQVQSRDQRRLDVVRLEPASGERTVLLHEHAETWVNLHDDLRFIPSDTGRPDAYDLLWSSERSGYRHLYLYSRSGQELRQLTRGDWAVDAVVGAHGCWVYFLAGRESPLERHIYRVSMEGGPIERLTTEPGIHSGVLAPNGKLLADIWDSLRQPPILALRLASGEQQATVFANDDVEARQLGLQAPELVELTADDGERLYGAIYRPSSGPPPWPLLVSVYGGPHVQQVMNGWGLTIDLRAQVLAQQGFLVFKLDNRGSARRGHGFEAAIHGHMGDLEVRDQVAGVRFLGERGEADITRVGIYGWSYGGYMTLMCLLRAPTVFRAGVAGAPVSSWDGYDTHYTERYMRTPTGNPDGYRESSAMTHVDRLAGELLLVHGLIDENVHFRHSARLINALIAANKPFDFLPFPDERHMPRSERDRVYMERRLLRHFQRSLLTTRAGDGGSA